MQYSVCLVKGAFSNIFSTQQSYISPPFLNTYQHISFQTLLSSVSSRRWSSPCLRLLREPAADGRNRYKNRQNTLHSSIRFLSKSTSHCKNGKHYIWHWRGRTFLQIHYETAPSHWLICDLNFNTLQGNAFWIAFSQVISFRHAPFYLVLMLHSHSGGFYPPTNWTLEQGPTLFI